MKALGRTMATDRATAEVVEAFRREGIRSILLKGPAVARWLYDEGALRTYVDADLLVSPDDFAAAEGILSRRGFEREALDAIPGDWPKHARPWHREDGANVDLHRTVPGTGVPDGEVWAVLWSRTERMLVGGADVEVLDLPGRALMVALHAAKDGPRVGKVRHDLGHALERVETAVWEEAARLAAELGALASFAAGLRLMPRGEALARELALPASVPLETALRRDGGAPPLAMGMRWLATSPGVRGKTRLVLRKVFPPPAFVRAWKPLARRGPLGLAAAYAWRPFWVAWRAIPAFRSWRRARREAEPGGPARSSGAA